MLKHLESWFWYGRKRWFYQLILAAMALTLCLGRPQVSYGNSLLETILQGVQVIQLSTLSDAQEMKLGKQINQQLIKQGKINIYNSQEIKRYLNRVGQRLAQSSDRPNIRYTFQVVNDENINAFATMGGFVYINTGLMLIADNEAELASVIAHEIGHITARHAIKHMRNTAITQGLLNATGLDESQAVQIGVELAFNLPNSREDELEADKLGLVTLERSGYASSAMISFMEKLLQEGGNTPSFLSSHPATSERIVALEKSINPATGSLGDGLNNQVYRQRINSIL